MNEKCSCTNECATMFNPYCKCGCSDCKCHDIKKMKVIFMGTPEFAVPILNTLIENTNVIRVVSQPDKEVGRKKEIKMTPIKELAMSHNIQVYQPQNIKEEFKEIIDTKPDLIVTCAYGQIIPKEILECAVLGCINVHASLLPYLRGGAPIHKALIEGHAKTGITIMYMDEKMDTGDIISQKEYVIKDSDNVEKLHEILSDIGSNLLLETLPSIASKTNNRTKQDDSLATYAWNIKREEECLDFNKSAKEVFNKVRGLNSWPLANTLINGDEFKIIECTYEKKIVNEAGVIVEITKDYLAISASDGIIYVTKIKPFGKKSMLVKDYLNGIKKEDLINKKVGE